VIADILQAQQRFTEGVKTAKAGFTGLHFHDNWGHEEFRKTVLNAICWIAGAEIPAEGIVTPALTQADLDANLDPKPQPKPKPKA
jgi:hypothetical protein